MTDENPDYAQASPSPLASTTIARVLGIDIRVHFSVVVIFALITTSLAANIFPQWHPEWGTAQNWIAAFSAAILFFVSLLTHEMAHSVVARRCGIEISAITLFIFGGVAEMKGEPKSPRDEFLIAGAGPLASFVLALVFGIFVSLLVSDPQSLLNEEDGLNMANLSAVATICMWLSSINFMLAVFNLLPGFPMDGGRLFRAAIWWRTGNLMQATQVAAQVGSGFGWVFIGLGAIQLFGGNAVNGLWLILIGWFIRRLALASVASMMLDQALRGFDVRAIMRTRFDKVPANTSIKNFIDDYLLRSTQQLWPVHADDRDIGYVTAQSFSMEDSGLKDTADNLDQHMHQLDQAHSINPDLSAKEAFERLAMHPFPLPVVEDGQVIGIITHADIVRWFSFHKIAS
jgi:Zn-dependent protease/predicted transcriptional regulator